MRSQQSLIQHRYARERRCQNLSSVYKVKHASNAVSVRTDVFYIIFCSTSKIVTLLFSLLKKVECLPDDLVNNPRGINYAKDKL